MQIKREEKKTSERAYEKHKQLGKHMIRRNPTTPSKAAKMGKRKNPKTEKKRRRGEN